MLPRTLILLVALVTLITKLTGRALFAPHSVGACQDSPCSPFVDLRPASFAWLVLQTGIALVGPGVLGGANSALPTLDEGTGPGGGSGL